MFLYRALSHPCGRIKIQTKVLDILHARFVETHSLETSDITQNKQLLT